MVRASTLQMYLNAEDENGGQTCKSLAIKAGMKKKKKTHGFGSVRNLLEAIQPGEISQSVLKRA